ncbi:junctional adhesion molecule B isoform X1 [Pleurodeles waltl]|uniref:junctional adhesion molecule B isoform X1 n=1 Tax=Pleurodeles waltl TaxID=8319 RepID=UPI003709AC57
MAQLRRRVVQFGFLVAVCCNIAMVVSVMTDNKKVEATEFDEAVLSCVYSLQRNSKYRLEWKKIERGGGDVSFVYYEGDIVGSLKGRAEMFDSSIRIKNVTRKDSAMYRCEVTTAAGYVEEVEVELTVLVLPATPLCDIPRNVMTGTVVELKCREKEGFPASQYDWFKDGERLQVQAQNAKVKTSPGSYTININSGTLQFNTVAKTDTGEYYCEAYNRVGRSQKCLAKKMQVDDLNVGGIVAAAVVVSLVIALCGLGVYHAHKKGYFSRGHTSQKSRSVYKPAPSTQNEFKHTKSFVI